MPQAHLGPGVTEIKPKLIGFEYNYTMATYFIFIFVSSFSTNLMAAPHPAMDPSTFVKIYNNKVQSAHGFELDLADSNWEMGKPGRAESLNYRIFRPSKKSSGLLSVRVEKLARKMKLKSYVKSWVREYPYYGFKMLDSKFIKQGSNKGFLVDFFSPEKKTQLRQVIFVKNQKAVVLTCSDTQALFQKTKAACTKIIRTFNWTN